MPAMTNIAKIKLMVGLAIVGLVITVVIAFPIVTHVALLGEYAGKGSDIGDSLPQVGAWVSYISTAVADVNQQYPFIFYMSDWLVFAHIVIAVYLIGAYKDPKRNTWIIEASLIACSGIIPLAFIAGEIRGIPTFWRLIDSSFGIICFIPLWYARMWAKSL